MQQGHTRSSFGQVRHLDLVDAEVLLGVVKNAPILPESSICATRVSTTRSRPHAAPDSTPAAGSPRQGPEHVPQHRFHPDAYVAPAPKPPVGGRLVTDVSVTTTRMAEVSVIARAYSAYSPTPRRRRPPWLGPVSRSPRRSIPLFARQLGIVVRFTSQFEASQFHSADPPRARSLQRST